MLIWRPEVVVRDDRASGICQIRIVKLNRGLVVFRDENVLGVCDSITVCIEGFTDPDIILIVSVFDDLNRGPFISQCIVGLFRNRG